MTTYILRRLLLIFPTLIGITMLVFFLMGMGGGVSAALQSQAGQMEASSRALQMAYLEDRYGLNDPQIVQYFRWLGRISPVKFGPRDLVNPEGEIISPPKPLAPPPAWRLITDALPEAAPVPEHTWPAAADADAPATITDPAQRLEAHKSEVYRRAAADYTRTRGLFIKARTDWEAALKGYAREANLEGAVNRDQELRPSKFIGITRATAIPAGADADTTASITAAWEEVEQTGAAALAAYKTALDARERVDSIFNATPYRRAGFGFASGGLWVGAPDFGMSFSKSRPVSKLIAEALPITLLMNIIALPIIYIIAIPFGMLAATYRGSIFDVASGTFFLALWAIPIVWAGTLAIGFLGSNDYLGWFPPGNLGSVEAETMTMLPSRAADGSWEIGWILDRSYHLVLPILCLVYAGFAVLSKQTRAAMLDNFNADYVRTARAKGVSGTDVVFRHVFRNSLLPLITIFARVFPAMLAGSIIVEKIFNINGMGLLVLDAIYRFDREVILANVLMIGTINILALLLADILYAVADPRIAYT